MPPEPPGPQTATEKFIFQEELKEYVKRKRAHHGNLATVYAVIWGQCRDAMKSKLKSLDKYTGTTTATIVTGFSRMSRP
jgi:hypothetical protein